SLILNRVIMLFFENLFVLIYGMPFSRILLTYNYQSLFFYYISSFRDKSKSSSLFLISVSDFLPKLRTFIISGSDLLVSSSTVLIPARFKQLYERTDKSSSSTVISSIFSFFVSSFSTM